MILLFGQLFILVAVGLIFQTITQKTMTTTDEIGTEVDVGGVGNKLRIEHICGSCYSDTLIDIVGIGGHPDTVEHVFTILKHCETVQNVFATIDNYRTQVTICRLYNTISIRSVFSSHLPNRGTLGYG